MFKTPPIGNTVILVDDDAALRTALTFNLEVEGFVVETYASGEALLLRNAPWVDACLVLDQHLPGISGLEALMQLRARQVDLPALIITSNLPTRLLEEVKAARATLIEKPLLSNRLLGAIRDALAS